MADGAIRVCWPLIINLAFFKKFTGPGQVSGLVCPVSVVTSDMVRVRAGQWT